jgi:guanylate kinase
MNSQGSLKNASQSEASDYSAGKRSGNLIVLSGPSGVGKGTVIAKLLEQVTGLTRSVSVTTRGKREGEVDGLDYFFLTADQFQDARAANELLEWAEFAGACYGTPQRWVEQQLADGKDVLLVIEVQGAKQIRQRIPEAVLIFLSPPSFEELEARLRGRATESPEKIRLRLNKARQELSQKVLFHYEVINDIVEIAVDNLAHIIYSERLRIRNSAQ